MKLRTYKSNDCPALAQLFYDTVHHVNAADYSRTQLEVWATGNVNIEVWNRSFLDHNTVIAEIDEVIVGFCDMDHTGYLDRLYVHHNYQRQGIATTMVRQLEQQAKEQGVFHFMTHASITAVPFFERQGYCVVRENRVTRGGVELTNFIMKKAEKSFDLGHRVDKKGKEPYNSLKL